VERKPLFHFFPGDIVFSLRGLCCNFRCPSSYTQEALGEIGPHLDAYCVGIKGFSTETHREVANFSDLCGILASTEHARTRWGLQVECITSVIPTMNDNPEELREIVRWIAANLGPDTPWHVTCFVPRGECSHLPCIT